MSEPGAVERLQRLRRLPQNKRCANCQTSTTLGFGAVCVKFKTFVCDHCKSAHQSFSHLCKSVTMSNWKNAEVDDLEFGGGNDVVREKWLHGLSRAQAEGVIPKSGDPLDTYKRFVNIVYEEKRYLSDGSGSSVSTSATATPTTQTTAATPPPLAKKSGMSNNKKETQHTPDLLSFDHQVEIVTKPATLPNSSFAFISGPSVSQQQQQQPPAIMKQPTVFIPPPTNGHYDPFAILHQPQYPPRGGVGVNGQFPPPMSSSMPQPQQQQPYAFNQRPPQPQPQFNFMASGGSSSAPTFVPPSSATTTTSGGGPLMMMSMRPNTAPSSSTNAPNGEYDPFAGLL